ncbi:MAG: hypothetical protein NVV82_07195 [Sporocytophaga sp.]|nr:hypothetical protein [Sporocytophaga sp.]
MGVRKDRYHRDSLELLYDYLRTYEKSKKPVEFEVYVDEVKAVSRTSDISSIIYHELLVNDETKVVSFILYRGKSNHNDKYLFYTGEIPKDKDVSEKEQEFLIKQRIEMERIRLEVEHLRKENGELKAKNKELKVAYKTIVREIEVLKSTSDKDFLNKISGLLNSILK